MNVAVTSSPSLSVVTSGVDPSTTDLHTLVFVDSSVEDCDRLLQGLQPNLAVIQINANENGMEKITETLRGKDGIANIHLITHGRPGSLQLGNSTLSTDTIERYSHYLQQWFGTAVWKSNRENNQRNNSSGRSLFLHACSVGQDRAFLHRLQSLTAATVHATERLYGRGNWQLETIVQTPASMGGTHKVTEPSPFTAEFRANYLHTFPDPTFAPRQTVAVAAATQHGTVVDLNQDGILDVAVIAGNNVSVLLGSGTGTFLPATNIPVTVNPWGITFGDFNSDGSPDLAISHESGTVSLLLNNGAGGFTPGIALDTGGIKSRSIFSADFNGDGRRDLVVLNADSNNLSVFLGNGNGSFAAAVNYGTGTQPYGVDAGDFDQDGDLDLAIAKVSGTNNLTILQNNGGVFTTIGNYTAGSNSQSLRVADFNNDNQLDVAIASFGSNSISIFNGDGTGNFSLSTTLSGVGINDPVKLDVADFNTDGKQDIVIANQAGSSLTIFSGNGAGGFSPPIVLPTAGEPQTSVLVGDFDRDGKADLVSSTNANSSIFVQLNRTSFLVTNTNDSGLGSLRQAILDANANSLINNGKNWITFDIPGIGPHTISPTSALPVINKPVVIDGYTQPGASPNTLADGSNAVFQIELDGSNLPAGTDGLLLTSNASGSVIRGLSIYNFAGSGADAGINLDQQTNTAVIGNLLGTNIAETVGIGNERGVKVRQGSNNRIGGLAPGDRNIIVGNNQAGVLIDGGTGHRVFGNLIGLTANDTVLANGSGVWVTSGASNTQVGSGIAGGRNVISGNGTGIDVRGLNPTQTWIAGNYIGTDATGAFVRANTNHGIVVDGATNTKIGTNGDAIADDTEGNLISGNAGNGILVKVSSATTIEGNLIGTNATGTAIILNTSNGIAIENSANTVIGGNTPNRRNVISGNQGHGLLMTGAGSTGNLVQGNFIGVGLDGSAIANQLDGIAIDGASNNTIGGVNQGNSIRFNRNGISVVNGTQNRISQNQISDQFNLDIDLGADGVTTNDLNDPDTGANNLQNFPVIATVLSDGLGTVVSGTFNSLPNTTYTLEFFNRSASTPTEFFLTSQPITTDSIGNASFEVTLSSSIMVESFIVATATDPNGNTSEFSDSALVQSTAPIVVSPTNLAIAEGGITATYTIVLKAPPSQGNVRVSLDLSSQLEEIPALEFDATNWNIPQTITLTAVDDLDREGDQTITLSHIVFSETDFRFNGSGQSINIAIADNDVPGITSSLPSGGLQLREGATAAAVTYAVGLNTIPTNEVQVLITADAQSLLSLDGIDFTTSQTFTRTDKTSQTIWLRAVNDSLRENNHTSTLTTEIISSFDPDYPVGLAIAPIIATIIDDDGKGIIITPTGGRTQVTEGADIDNYTIVLASQPTSDVVINLNPGSELTTEPTVLTFTPTNWNIAQTITVRAVDDKIVEPSFPFHLGIISHDAISADVEYDRLPAVSAAVNIADNDLNDRNQDCQPGQTLRGDRNKNRLVGTVDSDRLEGLGGDDTLIGGDCADVLLGGRGSDRLVGGAGRDRFTFNQVQEKGDRIVDFDVKQDRIDLSGIFAKAAYKSNRPLQDYVRLAKTKQGINTLVFIDMTPQTKGFSLKQENVLLTLEGIRPGQIKGSNFVV